MTANDVFYQHELDAIYTFPTNMLPTMHECLLYCLSRTRNRTESHALAVRDMAVLVYDIWSKADCCPCTVKYISTLFEKNVMEPYLYLLREKHLKGEKVQSKRSHKKDPSKITPEPSRKSRRHSKQLSATPDSDISPDHADVTATAIPTASSSGKETKTHLQTKSIKVSTRSDVPSLRKKWFTFANTLFDVKSETKVSTSYFDKDYYDDQCSVRGMVIYLSKVTKEFALQEEKRKKDEADKKK